MIGKRDHQITSESYFPLTKGQLKQKMFFSHTAGRPRLSAHSLGESRSCDPIYVLQNSSCPDLPLPPTLHIFLCMVKVSDRLLFFFSIHLCLCSVDLFWPKTLLFAVFGVVLCFTYSTDHYQQISLENCFTIKQTALNHCQPLPTPYKRKTKFYAAMYSMLLT